MCIFKHYFPNASLVFTLKANTDIACQNSMNSFCFSSKANHHSWERSHSLKQEPDFMSRVVPFSTWSVCPIDKCSHVACGDSYTVPPLSSVYSGSIWWALICRWFCNSTLHLLVVWLAWRYCQLADGFYSKYLSTQIMPHMPQYTGWKPGLGWLWQCYSRKTWPDKLTVLTI